MLLDTNNRRAISPIGMPRPSSTRTSISRFVNWTRTMAAGYICAASDSRKVATALLEPSAPSSSCLIRSRGIVARADRTPEVSSSPRASSHVLAAAGILPSSHRAAHSISRDSSRNLVRYCPLQSISRHNSNAWDGDPVRRCVRATETVTTANVCGAAD